jgi:glycosyltransferase involved in cell wall biosynthesis
LLQIEEQRVRRFEAREYASFDRVVVVSDRDRDALSRLSPELRLEVIPNGVDADFFAPNPTIESDPLRIVFTGVMSSPGNLVAAEFAALEVLPRVRKACPGARLALVGRAPPPRVRALAALDGVEVTGEVPDVRPWLNGSRVFLCPMISGTGIKNKMLEAMAAGMACVTTPLGAGGLNVQDGAELLVAESPQSLAARLIQVLSDENLARRLGNAARAYVRDHHSWSAVALRYERLLTLVRNSRTGIAT